MSWRLYFITGHWPVCSEWLLAQPRPMRMPSMPVLALCSFAPGSSVTYRPGMPSAPPARVTSMIAFRTVAGCSCLASLPWPWASKPTQSTAESTSGTPTIAAVAILLALTFSKNFYAAAFGSYYIFFLIDRFAVSVGSAQIHLFLFLGAVAVGTLIGGPIGDRIGRKPILWISMLGVLPLSLALPFANLFWTDVLAVLIGLTMASAFPAIVVYAQQLLPGRVGMIGGLFFGFAFGMGGIGAVLIGWLADTWGIEWAFRLCALLPAIGLLVAFLPSLDETRR